MTDPRSEGGSITRWYRTFRAGDEAAARELWNAYFHRMLQLARKHVAGNGVGDEEDVALSAFFVFCRSVEKGQFSQISSRDDLWRSLARVTIHKARDHGRFDRAKKRGGGLAPSVVFGDVELTMDQLAAPTTDPLVELAMSEECLRLLATLNDPDLESVALGKLEGCTNEELAGRLGVSRRTIQRMLNVIRRTWESEISS